MKKRSFAFLFLASSVLFVSACSSEDKHSPSTTIEYGEDHPISSNKGYATGALKPTLLLGTSMPKDVTYTIENQTDEPITLKFSSGLLFDAALKDVSGEIVYRRSEDLMATQALEESTLKQGEALSFEFELPDTLKTGEYTLKVWLDSQDEAYDLVSKAETTIQIEKP